MISHLLGLLGVASAPLRSLSALFPILSVGGAVLVATIPSWLRRRKKN